MAGVDYHRYLRSPEWAQKRAEAFAHYGRSCSRCGTEKQLQVHHKTYKRLFRERITDLEVLCKGCHQYQHGITEATMEREGREFKVVRLPDGPIIRPKRGRARRPRKRRGQQPPSQHSKFKKRLIEQNEALHLQQQTRRRRLAS